MKQAKTKVKKKGTVKKIVAFLHLWLGLLSGIIVFIVAITGCLFVFQQEISNLVHRDKFYVEVPKNAIVQPFSKLKETADKALGKSATFITTYRAPDKAWEFMCYEAGDQNALTFFGSINRYESVFVDPYTAKVTGYIDYTKDFFVIVKYIHWSLLLNTPYGQPIVGYATLLFVILLLTGLVLWWPKNLKKSNFNKSFKVKWKAGFKRLNYDLHNVPGFYALFITLILALTGMVWAMKWFETAVYVAASQSTTPPSFVTKQSDTTAVAASSPLDIAFLTASKEFSSGYDRIGLSPAFGKEGVIYAIGYRGKEVYYNTDEIQLDQYTGKKLYRRNYNDKNNGEKLIGMNYDIHVGAILGLPGKILAFLASLIASSLPITGFIIWYGRKKKSTAGHTKEKRPFKVPVVDLR
ncbi:PepSY-associated TM helix domain-containing protein [Olivibacter sp. CPCC 100613]|uniref:PepSY-associated TM helix domain-containing protein n=1 Tax=Olivibacter sp. CPCC 100613 TaxID=3079931 RepID=UPI002FF51A04